jgi:two-component system, OmpR family, phosphate regulon sensor histidine kinase PhoR
MSDRAKTIVRSICGAVAALAFLTSMITAAFFATAFLYTYTGFYPPAFAAQLINTLLGLFFAFLILFGLGTLFRSRRLDMEMGIFRPINDAIVKIAKGDFSVRVDGIFREHDVVGKLAKSVNTMAMELDQMEAMRQEFISNVSHEIQSPLTSIRGFARALQNDNLSPADRVHYLNIIEVESMRLSKLSDNLLALASLDAEHIRFEPRPYRLDRQIRNLIVACEPQWNDKSIDMDVALEEVSITADEDMLSQVWINLIHNGVKFTPCGGSMRVDLRYCEENIVFRIADTGIGISKEDQAHVFERFFKAEKARDRARGGSGLGLAIAKKIVEMHKGTIGVESEPGAGASFTISLPVNHRPQ